MTLDLDRQVLPCIVDATPAGGAMRLGFWRALRGEMARLDESAAAIQLSRTQIAAIVERRHYLGSQPMNRAWNRRNGPQIPANRASRRDGRVPGGGSAPRVPAD